MFYFFLNIVMCSVINGLFIVYFKKRINLISFIFILLHLNLSIIFIMNNYNLLLIIPISLTIIIFYHFFNLFEKNNEEIVLIKDGNINFHNLISNYSFKKLLLYLKVRHIRLDEIAYCIKSNNDLLIIKNDYVKYYPVSIIIKGNLLEENLKLINKNKDWLEDELRKKEIYIKSVNYAYYLENKIYFVM